ncbi:MAG: ABC transporter ATP-binding protein [Gaiellales bacterium]
MSAIALAGVGYRYPGADTPSLRDIDLVVDPGRIVILEGPSGGGKTTLLRVLAGLAPAFHGGEAWGVGSVAGLDLRTAQPSALAQRIGFLFQEPEAQGVMGETLRDVAYGLQCRGWAQERILPAARAALAAVGCEHLVGRRLDALSSGERQRVALAAVLAPEPALLLLDEPTAQLDDDAACELVGHLRRFADRGLAIVISEHRTDRVGHLADEVLGIVAGRIGAAPAAPSYPRSAPAPGRAAEPALVLEGVELDRGGRRVLRGASASRPTGASIAQTGPNGAGKSTLMRAIAGLDAPLAGAIRTARRDLTGVPAAERVPEIRLVPQDPGRTLLEATAEAEIRRGADALGMPPGPADRAIADLGLSELLERHPRDLSVGERERVAIAAALAVDPTILLLDEPTRGMDAAHRATLVRILGERHARGLSVITATHDRAFVRATAHALWIVGDGRLVTGEPIPEAVREAAR